MNKKQQIVHIGGGESWKSSVEHIEYLRNKKCDPYEFFKRERWHYHYYSFLDEEKFDLIKPNMPCRQNAHYEEWKIWFERHFPFLENEIILVGHSLGGGFIARYLSEKIIPFSVKQLHLIAPTYDYDANLAEFSIKEFPKSFLENEIGEIHFYHSKDDKIVPISESEKYVEKLPMAHFHIFTDRGHFLDETFPELFENIKKSQ